MGLQIVLFAAGFFFIKDIQVTETENPEADKKRRLPEHDIGSTGCLI